MKSLALKIVVASVIALMTLGTMTPAAAEPAPLQAPTEVDMGDAMTGGADWMLTIVGTDGQMSLPFDAPLWEAESAGRLCMNGLALLRAYQTTGQQTYLDRAVAAGDLAASSVDAGSRYVIDRMGLLPTDAYGGFTDVQSGKVDDAFSGSYTGVVNFKLWETINGIWFLTELHKETGDNNYINMVLLLDRLMAEQFYIDEDMGAGVHSTLGLSNSGTWTKGGRASMTQMGLLLKTITIGEEDLINLWRDRYSLVSFIRPQQNSDGSFDDGADLPSQDSQKETKHALMIGPLYDIGVPKEADKLVQWVQGQLQGDGHYSCPHDKDVMGDTSAAAMGLLPIGEVADGGEAVSWLLTQQKGDGSWDPTSGLDIETTRMQATQWAMLAVHAGLSNVNLAIDDDSVTTSAVWEGDPARVMAFTVNVTVENEGLITAEGVLVKVFDGPKGGGNTPMAVSNITVNPLDTTFTSLEFRPDTRGPHQVHVWVDFPPGGEFRTRDNNLSKDVNLNREPTGRIEVPTEGQLFGFGAVIEFKAADIVDLDGDDVSLTWTDNMEGVLSTEEHFHHVLMPGDHRVTLTFEDGNGPSNTANVSFSVRENIPPTIRISTPAEGARYFDYQRITFDASASSDAEDHYLYYSWNSDKAGHLGNGAEIHKKLAPGQHRVTVWVDDTWDNVSKSVTITVVETFPPDILISSPMDGETYVTTTRVEFDASGTTDPDSEILQFFWYSNIDGKLSERDSFLAKLSVGQHILTLAVDDGNYNVTESITIDVLENRAPVAVISNPEDESEFDSDQLIELNGSQSYDLEDPITYFWVSARSGPLGNKPVLELFLPRGEHMITLWVDDDHGHNVSTMITVTVLNLGPTAGISSPEEGTAYLTGNPVFFNSDTSFDPEGDKLFYEWYVRSDAGDWTAIGTQSTAQRTFDTPGTFHVRLVVSDGKMTDQTQLSFEIEQAPDGNGGTEEGFLEGPMLIGIIIVVVAVVGVVVVLMMRSRD
ncbi:MAG: PKD domain-containing protein [Thermoplasmata archaeon]|nr:MAG: PKD domain-containing protein [Thermoplasmata archaeon]